MIGNYFTVSQAAAKLQVHVLTVYAWIRSGKLQAKRLPGGGLRIEAAELEKLLSENKGRQCKSSTNASL